MPRIVVGVDGSESADMALRWALDEARLRGASLRVVHAWSVPLVLARPSEDAFGIPEPVESVLEARAALQREATSVLERALEELSTEAEAAGPACARAGGSVPG